MENKKVLNIIQRYHPAKGGAELFMKILSEYQQRELGYDVNVWTTNALSPSTLWDLGNDIVPVENENIEGVKVRRFPIGKGITSNKYVNKAIRFLFDTFPNFKIANLASCPTAYRMLDTISKEQFSDYAYITVSSTPYYFLFYIGYLISKEYGIPYIIVPAFHTGESKNDPIRKIYYKKNAVPFFEYATNIILNTNAEKEAIMDFCKEEGIFLEENKFLVIGQGVFIDQILGGDGKRFRKKYNINDPIIFQMGSKNHEKGSYNLVESMKKVWDRGVKCSLVFGGQYDLEFSKFINKLETEYKEKIINIDNISDEEKFDAFDACDIFSMVSKTDSFGIVYLEAWTYGKPVLACRNNALSEIVTDGKDGFLFGFDDVDAVSETIISLLNDSKERKRIGENGKGKVLENYNWNENLKKLNNIYKNI